MSHFKNQGFSLRYQEAWERLLSAKKIAIFTHHKPDGDTLGSALALHHRLQRLGKKSYLYNPSPALIPLELRFLREIHRFSDKLPENADVWVFVDCASPTRAGIEPTQESPWILNIDHHESNTRFGSGALIDSSKVATGVLVYELLKAHEMRLSRDEAEALYASILTDSNFFRNDRVDASLYRLCAELLEAGIEVASFNNSLARSLPLAKARLQERLLSRLALHHDAQIATSYLSLEDFEACGGGVEMLEGMSDSLLELATVKVSLFAYELAPKRWRFSLRSRAPYECHTLATLQGGGGHPRAAGYVVDSPSLSDSLQEAIKLCKERLL